LSDSAKAAWKSLLADLRSERLLNPVDSALIELTAVALGRVRDARAVIEAEGMIVTGAKGNPVKNPAVLIEQQAGQEARRLLELLGLGPTARSRIATSRSPGYRSMDDFDREHPRGRDVLVQMEALRQRNGRGHED
jgi:P27 family predicted phage terminase small subunit